MHKFIFSFRMYGQGWSETLFRAAPFESGQGVFLDNYITKRLHLLTTDAAITSVRASNVDTPRDIIIYLDPTTPRRGTWVEGGDVGTATPGTDTNAENTFSSLLTRLSDGGSNFRSFKIVGLPDYVTQGNIVVPAENPILRNRLNSWIQAMSTAGFGMKSQGAAAAAGRIVQFFPKTPENQLVCLGITGGALAAGDYVTLGKVKGFPKLNRQWKVAEYVAPVGDDPAYIYLAGSSALNTFGPVQDGTWKKKTFGLTVLSQYTISGLRARKTGVPFGTVRGRR